MKQVTTKPKPQNRSAMLAFFAGMLMIHKTDIRMMIVARAMK
jgi:hypothetical protein